MRVPRMAIGLILTALLVNCATGAPRGSRGWEFLGKRDVDFRVDQGQMAPVIGSKQPPFVLDRRLGVRPTHVTSSTQCRYDW